MWDAPTHKVILEVDEHQHRHITPQCEQKRMQQITYSLGMPTFWVRFNPDQFKGAMNQTTDKDRRDLLIRVLKASFAMPPAGPNEYCRVQHLFFDGFVYGQPVPVAVIPVL